MVATVPLTLHPDQIRFRLLLHFRTRSEIGVEPNGKSKLQEYEERVIQFGLASCSSEPFPQ
jgi:hypothetical protein